MGKSLAQDTHGTADPDCSKRYPVLYNGMLSNKTEVGAYQKIAQRLAGHQSDGSE